MIEIKIQPEPFEAWKNGVKRSEFRKLDRDYQVGHEVMLKEYKPKKEKGEPDSGGVFTGRGLKVEITYIEAGPAWGIPEGYGVLHCRNLGFINIK